MYYTAVTVFMTYDFFKLRLFMFMFNSCDQPVTNVDRNNFSRNNMYMSDLHSGGFHGKWLMLQILFHTNLHKLKSSDSEGTPKRKQASLLSVVL